LVPADSFAEYAPGPNPATGENDVVRFALNDDGPLVAFAVLWTEFNGECALCDWRGPNQIAIHDRNPAGEVVQDGLQ
jgi:hypothetical protein